MNLVNSHTSILGNGWIAEFNNLGEFRMSCEGWDLMLNGPAGQSIRYFQKQPVLINDHDGKKAQSCIEISDDGVHGYLKDDFEQAWVLDFKRRMIAPHRLVIRHHSGEKYIAALEQPAFKRTQEYIRIGGRLIYITFPFAMDSELSRTLDDYLHVRKRQLDELYYCD